MASVNYNDITPEEQQRLSEAKKQHEDQLQASKNLEDTIKQLAANNRRDGNKDKIAYTENRLAIREYSDSMRNNMTQETSKLFEQLEEINVQSRKQTKSEQRENLKQLEVLRELSKNIQDDEQRIELQNFVDSTEQSIRMNTNKFTAFVSKSMDNFGDIGAILSGLNDSPLLSMGFAYFGNKITNALSERREQKYALQEGTESQLFELLQEREKSAKKQEEILAEIAKRQDDNNNNNEPESDSEVKLDGDSLSQLSNDEVVKQLDFANEQLLSIDDSLQNIQKVPDNTTQEPTIENNQDIIINNVESDLDLSQLSNDEVVKQLDFANEQLLSIDDSLQNLQKVPEKSSEPSIENVVNNTINVPELDLSNINISTLQDLLEESNYELISINSSIQDFLNNTIAFDKNSSQEPVQIPLNDEQRDLNEEMVYQLLDINEKLAPLLNGLEERERESELYNEQLLSAIQNLKGDSSIAGVDNKDSRSLLGKVFDVLKVSLGVSLSGIIGGFIGSMVGNFKSVLKNVAKAIPKVLSKLFVPVTIVMGLFSGVTEAIAEFKKTGSVKDAVIGFFGGILDFLTFGLLGTDSINSVVDSISSYIQPLFDTLKKPFEYVSNWLDGIFGAENMDTVFEFLRKLNPVTIMVDNIKFMFKSVTKLINELMSIDYGKMISEQVKSMLPDNFVGDKIRGLFDEEDEEPTRKRRQLSERQLKIIETKRARMREHLNGVYKVNDIPMNKQDYKKASNSVLNPENGNSNGNNSFSNINVANNNQTIVAPLPEVRNFDNNIRRLNNNPY